MILALVGPTASGKSSLAMALAERLAAQGLPSEIISMDSALVYRGMDVGTAKPTQAERAAVPHHLIDVLDPTESYSAAAFAKDASHCVRQIQARGALPIVVGGTMLYLKAWRNGLSAMPSANPATRQRLDAQAAEVGWPAMHALLREVDPATAQRPAPHDAQRIQRALEVWHTSGRPLSEWHADAAPRSGDFAPPESLKLVSLEPHDRGWLHERIALRFDAMMSGGLIAEVRGLMARGDLHPDLPSMRCVGYRQAWAALQTDDALQRGQSQWHALRETGVAATRQLAKRQLTWLRSMPDRLVVDCDAPETTVLETVWQHLLPNLNAA